MNFFNIPGLNGYKTIVGSYVQMICGLFLAIVELLKGFNDCIQGVTAISICLNTLPVLFLGVVAAGSGLAQLGIGHKIEKAKAALPQASSDTATAVQQ
jgi:hypothetical protein